MKSRHKLIDIILLALIFVTLTTREVKAYLDPGSSSYLLQILLAGFFSLLLAVKTFWKKIAALINKIFNKDDNDRQ